MSEKFREVGVHIRLLHSPICALEKAVRLGITCYQSFFSTEVPRRAVRMSRAQIMQFKKMYAAFGGTFYLHASYWINLADVTQTKHPILEKEIELAKFLGCTHIILHPGTVKGTENKQVALDVIASFLMNMKKREPGIIFILENTAHAGASIGGDLQDFAYIRSKLDHPDAVKFCIDTAHAYLFGYDIITDKGQEDFVALLEQAVGIHNIVLFHLNDTKQLCGSKIDQHAVVGQGAIGFDALKKLVTVSALKDIPLIMEMPSISEDEEKKIIDMVKSW